MIYGKGVEKKDRTLFGTKEIKRKTTDEREEVVRSTGANWPQSGIGIALAAIWTKIFHPYPD